MTAEELTKIDSCLASAQKVVLENAAAGNLDGVQRLITALRMEISGLKETATQRAADAAAPAQKPDALADVCQWVERAMDAIRTSPSCRTTIATKLYASLTALRAQVVYVLGAGTDRLASSLSLLRGRDSSSPVAARNPSPCRPSLAGIPNLAHHGWRDIERAEHIAGLHDTEQALLHSAAEFIADGLWRAERVIVIATEPHRRELEARLRHTGVDIVSASVRRKYVARDADEFLQRITLAGALNRAAFDELVAALAPNGSGSRLETRLFSELATRLWQREDRDGALEMETWWSDFSRLRGVSVFCGFPMGCFTPADEDGAFAELCRRHARVVPPESHVQLRGLPTRQSV